MLHYLNVKTLYKIKTVKFVKNCIYNKDVFNRYLKYKKNPVSRGRKHLDC